MKKIFLLLLVSLFMVTGCFGSSRISTEKSVYKYLKKKYPEESFTVQFYRNVTVWSSMGGCDEAPGHTWSVTSKNTGVSFYVQDDYDFNSFTCYYHLVDNYFDVYLSEKIDELNDSRVVTHEKLTIDDEVSGYGFLESISAIDLNLNDFSSEQELAEVAVSVQKTLLEDERIKDDLSMYFWFNIYDGDSILCSIDFSSADNVDFIISEIDAKKES